MIRRDFMKLLSIATAGLAVFRSSVSTPVSAAPVTKSQRRWLSGSARSGCARIPGYDPLPQ